MSYPDTLDTLVPTTENIRYAPHLPTRMEFYENAESQDGGNAALVFIHGGSWSGNDRTLFRVHGANGYDLCAYALQSGLTTNKWNVFSIDYRMSAYTGVNPSSYPSLYPDGFNDTACAVQFIKDNAASFGINPSKVVLFGSSAGGTNALHTAFRRSQPYFAKTSPAMPRRFAYRSSSSVAAVVNFIGPIDFRYDEEEGTETWTYNHNTAGWSGLFGHSLTDSGAEWSSAELDAVKEAASPLAYIEMPVLEQRPSGVYSVYNATSPTGKPYANLHASEQAAILHAALDAAGIENDYEVVTSGAWEDYTPSPTVQDSPSYMISGRVMTFIEDLL